MATKTSVTMTRKQAAEQANLAKRREVCGFFFKKKKTVFFCGVICFDSASNKCVDSLRLGIGFSAYLAINFLVKMVMICKVFCKMEW